jgi:hypothetical protein
MKRRTDHTSCLELPLDRILLSNDKRSRNAVGPERDIAQALLERFDNVEVAAYCIYTPTWRINLLLDSCQSIYTYRAASARP